MSSDEQALSHSESDQADDPNAPPQHPHVDVDVESGSDASENFSNYASSIASSTTSLNSDIFNYQYENGRRYHAYRAGKYLLPNDETEQDRLDMTHHVFRLSLGGDLCITKLKDPRAILDVGTGTGIWAIEMGDLYPEAEVVGTDLSPIQPQFVPPNVRFVIDDATDEWTFPPDHFDFIFSTYRWLMEWRKLSAQMQFDIYQALPKLVDALPFTNVKTVEKLCPLGAWPKDKSLKEIGRWFKAQFLEMALEAYTLALFVRVGGWQELEVKALLAHVRSEMSTSKMHLYTFCSYLACEKTTAL
ncbi:Secondary metabolism regulator laeA [Pseudocercospora fuligena]|uniref:Secondary metabolism regulator laeA n=1 Tax=Pseudocercospora fuligena TaxID=685502 RepID=A0A8H6VKV3_9PEZI|nr:Secondary metabolism regulator laeA [Pseudocercospora fuligena]